jgi:hypothetical protein
LSSAAPRQVLGLLISESGSFSVRSRSAAQPDRRQIRMHDRQRPGVVVDLVDCAQQRLFVLNDEPEQGQRTGSSTSSRKGRHQPTKDPDRAGQIAGSTEYRAAWVARLAASST